MLQTPDSAFVSTLVAGGSEGTYFNDLITLGWPGISPLDVKHPITVIEVRHGWVVDALNITYKLKDGTTKQIKHGAESGGNSTVIQLSEDEVLADISGKAGYHSYYKKALVCQLSLVIFNEKTSTFRTVGPLGNGDNTNQGAVFHDAGTLAFAGYETSGAQTGISGLSFITSKAWE
ncbi:hypothetical protein Clacol_002143 [Clathrus columnatus]|uniref:Jacalin-type lectin domain-containing protein n=1 Tax=Clathrus columnatus TaxID=1419009 RepID=A0AAV4ZZX3_9AGAM|nr:hypothetical protein Clacol_002143 [Clathrus columnatus]